MMSRVPPAGVRHRWRLPLASRKFARTDRRDRHAEIFENASEFLVALPENGCILLNVDDTRTGLAELLAAIRRAGRFYATSLYSESINSRAVVRPLRDGAIDYLAWPFDPEALGETLDHLAQERRRRHRIETAKTNAKRPVERLTGREHDVLLSLLDGNSNKQIAADLDLSPRTVEFYRKNVVQKLEAKSTSEAVRIGVYADLWEPPGATPFITLYSDGPSMDATIQESSLSSDPVDNRGPV